MKLTDIKEQITIIDPMTTRPFGRGRPRKQVPTTLGRPPSTSQFLTPDLHKPVDLFGLRQVLTLFGTANEEVRRFIAFECNVIYECRACRGLFRSLANFVLHKRMHCREVRKEAKAREVAEEEKGSEEEKRGERESSKPEARRNSRKLIEVLESLSEKRKEERDGLGGKESVNTVGDELIKSKEMEIESVFDKTEAVVRSDGKIASFGSEELSKRDVIRNVVTRRRKRLVKKKSEAEKDSPKDKLTGSRKRKQTITKKYLTPTLDKPSGEPRPEPEPKPDNYEPVVIFQSDDEESPPTTDPIEPDPEPEPEAEPREVIEVSDPLIPGPEENPMIQSEEPIENLNFEVVINEIPQVISEVVDLTEDTEENDSPPPPPSKKAKKTKFNSEEVSLKSKSDDYVDWDSLRCLPCEITFKSDSNVMEHMATHFNWFRYQCAKCTFVSYEIKSCEAHIRIDHKSETNESLVVPLPHWKTVKLSSEFRELDKRHSNSSSSDGDFLDKEDPMVRRKMIMEVIFGSEVAPPGERRARNSAKPLDKDFVYDMDVVDSQIRSRRNEGRVRPIRIVKDSDCDFKVIAASPPVNHKKPAK